MNSICEALRGYVRSSTSCTLFVRGAENFESFGKQIIIYLICRPDDPQGLRDTRQGLVGYCLRVRSWTEKYKRLDCRISRKNGGKMTNVSGEQRLL